MADGPVANLPPGLDAYAGYVNKSGIGETWTEVEQLPSQHHLSITTNGSPAMCADVEKGAMTSWAGYDYGYCSVSNVNALVEKYGRPRKLWTAHYDPKYGKHICSPACWPGLVTTADGTQWIDHNGQWDESLLEDDFFGPVIPSAPLPGPTTYPGDNMKATPITVQIKGGNGWVASPVPAAKVTGCVPYEENPGVVGRYDNPPLFRGIATQNVAGQTNGALVFSGFVDGTYGMTVWSVD